MGVSAEVPTLGSVLVTQSLFSWEGLASHLLTLGSSPALPRAPALSSDSGFVCYLPKATGPVLLAVTKPSFIGRLTFLSLLDRKPQ